MGAISVQGLRINFLNLILGCGIDKIWLLNNKILNIPHSKIKFRKFILKPWTDIAPDYILPNSKSSIKELLGNISHLKDRVREYN